MIRLCAASSMSCWTCAVSRSSGPWKFHRITLTEILRDLEPLNEGRDTRHRITYVGLWDHASVTTACRESGLRENPDEKEFEEFKKALRGNGCRTPIE